MLFEVLNWLKLLKSLCNKTIFYLLFFVDFHEVNSNDWTKLQLDDMEMLQSFQVVFQLGVVPSKFFLEYLFLFYF